ncbi:MAG: aminopeptidase [Patescibacteria group bacterium]
MLKLTPQELTAARNVMKQCMGIKPGESVLIVTDPARSNLAGIFAAAAKAITKKVELVSFNTMTGNAQEPPPLAAQKMKTADVALLVTTYSLSHTKARKNASQNGCRIASMPGITLAMAKRTLTADFTQMAALSTKLAEILSQANSARLTSAAGTDLTFTLTGRLGDADTGLYTTPGLWGNLPAGEACIGPLENKTQGTLIIDGAMAEINLDQPIKIIIKDGLAIDISGGQAAKRLTATLRQAGPQAFQVAELGIGTNPLAQLSPNILEAEKVYATCHVAFGNNLSYGGIIDVPVHEDGVILQPTLQIDGKIILKAGKFLL